MAKRYKLEDIDRAIQVEEKNIARLQQAVQDSIKKKENLMDIRLKLKERKAENIVYIGPVPDKDEDVRH